MQLVKNDTETRIFLPDGTMIEPGQEIPVDLSNYEGEPRLDALRASGKLLVHDMPKETERALEQVQADNAQAEIQPVYEAVKGEGGFVVTRNGDVVAGPMSKAEAAKAAEQYAADVNITR